MNATIESLNELHKRLLAEAEEQDGLGMAEVLAGNIVKENMQRGMAAGLRMAAAMVTEEIDNQKDCAAVDAMSDDEVEEYLNEGPR